MRGVAAVDDYEEAMIAFLLMYGLATFRLSVLLSLDSGPWRAISRFRSWLRREEKKSPALKKSDAAHGVECIRCSSIHIALAVATYAYFRSDMHVAVKACGDIFLSGMSLSAAAIIFSRAFPSK